MNSAVSTSRKTVVLVHGAWRGGWAYARVAELLRLGGHRIFTPTLTGVGDRSHLVGRFPITSAVHIQDVINVLRWEELDDVVLCGHSYGGVVITGVADALPNRVRSLVYLDAMIPESGKSVLDLNHSPQVVEALLRGAAACGGEVCPAFPAASFGTNSFDLEWADRLSTPHPLASFCDAITLTGAWRTVPKKIYVRATGWPGYEQLGFRAYASIEADEDWDKIDVPCGHDVMLDAPEVLADLLVNVA